MPVRTKDSDHEWTPFELHTMLCLIAKGVHLEEGRIKRNDEPGTGRINAYENFATQLNFALHGTDYQSDIHKREITHTLDQILEERKHSVGKGGLVERFPVGRVTAHLRKSFARDDLGFDGSLSEWKQGRREKVMVAHFMKMKKFREVAKLGFQFDQDGNAVGLGLTIDRYGSIIADENIRTAPIEAESRQKIRRSAAGPKKPRTPFTKRSRKPLSNAIIPATEDGEQDTVMSSIETDAPSRGPTFINSTERPLSKVHKVTESTISSLAKPPADLPAKSQEWVDPNFLFRTRSTAPTTKVVDANDLFGTGGSGFKPINWAATANDLIAKRDDHLHRFILNAVKDNGMYGGGGSSRRHQNYTDNMASAGEGEMMDVDAPAQAEVPQAYAVFDMDLFGGTISSKKK